MASILPRILEFRIDPDRRRAAIRLQNWMLDFMNMDPALPVTEQDLLSSEALRQMVYNYISDARDAAHPTLGHAPNFYHLWRDYLQTYDCAQYEPLDNNTQVYGARRDLDNPMEEPRHYYSEEIQ